MTNNLSGVDWIELLEPQNNQIVYISLSTGITSEKKPLNVEIKNAYDFEWWELLDNKSNRYYYFNTKSKETTWSRPQSLSIIPFGNVQTGEVDLMRSQNKILNYASGQVNKRNSASSTENRHQNRPPDNIQITGPENQSDCISLDNSESPIEDLNTKLETQCRLSGSDFPGSNDNATTSISNASTTMTTISADSSCGGGGLSTTPSIKHRPFPRTNPRSVPRRSGGAESPITHGSVSSTIGTSGSSGIITGVSVVTSGKNQGRSRRGGQHQTQSSLPISSGLPEPNTGNYDDNGQSSMLPLSGSGNQLMLQQQQRCHSRGSLSSAGTDSTNHLRMSNANNSDNPLLTQNLVNMSASGTGIGLSQDLTAEISSSVSNSNNNHGNSSIILSNGNINNTSYPVYDHPPSSCYMPHNQNYIYLQQQQQSQAMGTNRMTSPIAIHHPDTFSLRRPQSEQTIGTDINRQRNTMVSPRSDVLPNLYPTNTRFNYNPVTNPTGGPGAWSAAAVAGTVMPVDRSMSPPPPPGMPPGYGAQPTMYHNYPGPLPGWNSELFRKDQAPAKLLNWSKDNIQKPLLVSTDKILKSEACQAFKQIQSYMGDRKSKHSPTELVTSIIQKGINYYPLRDEIFMQICKQTTNNPDELSTLRGWELLRTCLTYFAPSTMFRPYLEGYILRHLDTGSNTTPGVNNSSNTGEIPTPLAIQQSAEQTIMILSRQLAMVTMQHQQQYYQQQQQQIMFMNLHQTQQHQQIQQSSQTHLSQSSSSGGGQKSSQLQLYDSSGGTSQFEQEEDGSQRCLLALSSHFGYTLEEIMRGQYLRFPDRELPWILVTLCEEMLRRGGESAENIFRASADPSAVQALCTVLDQCCGPISEHPLTAGDISPHTPARALLRWLDSLVEPLVPQALLYTQPGRGASVAKGPIDVYQGLSRLHQAVLMYLVRFLQLLSLDDHVRANRMGPWNFAVALAPHVFQLEQSPIGNNATTGTNTTNTTSDYGGSRSSGGGNRCQRSRIQGVDGGSNSAGLDTCRSDDTNNSANDSSGSSSRGGTGCPSGNSIMTSSPPGGRSVVTISNSDDQYRPQINFLYQLIVGLDTSPLDGVI